MKTTKSYFIDNYKIKKNANVLIEMDNTEFVLDPSKKSDDNNIALSDEELKAKIKPIMDAVDKEGGFNGTTEPLTVKKEAEDFIRMRINFKGDGSVPTVEEVKTFIINRNQTFSK